MQPCQQSQQAGVHKHLLTLREIFEQDRINITGFNTLQMSSVIPVAFPTEVVSHECTLCLTAAAAEFSWELKWAQKHRLQLVRHAIFNRGLSIITSPVRRAKWCVCLNLSYAFKTTPPQIPVFLSFFFDLQSMQCDAEVIKYMKLNVLLTLI